MAERSGSSNSGRASNQLPPNDWYRKPAATNAAAPSACSQKRTVSGTAAQRPALAESVVARMPLLLVRSRITRPYDPEMQRSTTSPDDHIASLVDDEVRVDIARLDE